MAFDGFWNVFYCFEKLSARGVYFGKYGNHSSLSGTPRTLRATISLSPNSRKVITLAWGKIWGERTLSRWVWWSAWRCHGPCLKRPIGPSFWRTSKPTWRTPSRRTSRFWRSGWHCKRGSVTKRRTWNHFTTKFAPRKMFSFLTCSKKIGSTQKGQHYVQ